ncbi:UreD-domain-containing protein, partial [Gorgonomyces haynaldii]
YPLSIQSTQSYNDNLLLAYLLNYGGGLVGGDCIDIQVSVSDSKALALHATASTKVYKQGDAVDPSSQSMTAIITNNALLAVLPEPVVCFKDSRYRQKQVFQLHNGSLVFLDWYLCGRSSLGERWQFQEYESVTEIYQDNILIIKDCWRLDNTFMDLASRMEPFECYCNLFLIGERVQESIKRIQQLTTKLNRNQSHVLLWACSPIEGGLVVRGCSQDTIMMREWLQ